MFETVLADGYALTPDFSVQTQDNGNESGLSFAPLAGGGFVAIWYEYRFGADRVYAQRFDGGGRPVGERIEIATDAFPGSVAGTPTGGFLVTWASQAPGTTGFDIKARFFDAAGSAIGSQSIVNTYTTGFQTDPQVTALAQGGYVVTWATGTNGSAANHVRGQVLDAAGNKIGAEIIVTDAFNGTNYTGDLTALAGGGFVATWEGITGETDANGNLSWGTRAQLFDGAGNKIGASFALNTIVPGRQSAPDIAALPGGGFVAAWIDDGAGGAANRGVWIRMYNAAGQPTGDPVLASAGAADMPALTATPTGFLLVWNAGGMLKGQGFDSNGAEVGAEFSLASDVTDTSQLLPQAMTLANGSIVVGWLQRYSNGFSGDDVALRVLVPTVHGTDGDDSFAGTAERDFYLGHGGNDTASGGESGDGLSGGAGSDILTGNAGADLLDGGTGADQMTGGTGNDLYFVDDAGDTVVELAGEGRDMVVTTLADYQAGNAVEDVVGTLETGVQTLRGNALSNYLAGGGADNHFDLGTGGHDVVHGGGGVDTLHIDWSDTTNDVTSTPNVPPFFDAPSALLKDGTARSVSYRAVEHVVLATGSGNDVLGTPPTPFGSAPVSTRITSGAGDDVAYLNSSLDTFDGGTGIDGVFVGNPGTAAGAFEWRIPTNLFLSPAGSPQLSGVEYFIQANTGSGNDIVETGRIARDEEVNTGDGTDLVIFYDGVDRVNGGGGIDTVVIDWRDTGQAVSLFFENNGFDTAFVVGSARIDDNSRSVSFVLVERFVIHAGTAADTLRGHNQGDEIFGGAGHDTI
ncbi:MAG TPA: calcium-binding protein, partial [Allosphingosinicella sp.]